jgi:beta-1,4-mannosyltransferase
VLAEDAMALTVLESFPQPRATTNPYIVMLAEALTATPGLRMLHFSWRTALLGRYDVFHAHWPEILVSGQTPVKKVARQVLFALLLARLRLTRTPIVRTRHNLGVHDGVSWREGALLGLAERMTTLWILINALPTDDFGDGRTVQILHGHYRDWFARYPRDRSVRGRMAYFGLVRRYKNVEALVRVFRDLPGEFTLTVSGNPDTEQLADDITQQVDGDARIDLDLRFLGDDELVSTVSKAELVVLPYREMHNSGSVLAALSLDRPVLVPANQVNGLLAAEVGESWVLRYDGDLSTKAIESAFARIRDHPPESRPDLSRREWSAAGADHLAAFHEASRRRKRRRAPRAPAADPDNPGS